VRSIAERSKQGSAALKTQLEFHRVETADKSEAIRSRAEDLREREESRKETEADRKAREEGEAIDKTAEALASYRLRPPTGYAARSPYALKLMDKVLEIDPSYDATRFDEKRKAVLSFATGPQGDKVRSLSVAISHMDVLSDLGTALGNHDAPKINQLANWWSTNVGGDAPTSFDAAKQIVGDEIYKAIVPGAGAAGERERMAASASAASSPKQLAGVIQTWKRLQSGQLAGLKRQYRTSTGLSNFDEMMSPEALQELEAEGPATPGAGTASAPATQGWGAAQVVTP
jgi:hypothetical protein